MFSLDTIVSSTVKTRINSVIELGEINVYDSLLQLLCVKL